jgi:hypothetical protein
MHAVPLLCGLLLVVPPLAPLPTGPANAMAAGRARSAVSQPVLLLFYRKASAQHQWRYFFKVKNPSTSAIRFKDFTIEGTDCNGRRVVVPILSIDTRSYSPAWPVDARPGVSEHSIALDTAAFGTLYRQTCPRTKDTVGDVATEQIVLIGNLDKPVAGRINANAVFPK